MDYTKITILGHEFHDDEWSMILGHYYYMCCATITSFIMETLRSIWTIEFANIIRDSATKLLHDVNTEYFVHYIDLFVGTILIYGCILVLAWIAGFCVRFIVGLLGSIATTKDTTENKDAAENKNPIHAETEDLTPSSSMGLSSSSTATPPLLVREPTGLHTAIEQWHDIKSLLLELETKMREFELCLSFEEFSLSDSTL